FGVAGRQVRYHPHAAEFNRFAIVQDAVRRDGREGELVAPLEVATAPGGQLRRVGFADGQPRPGQRLQLRQAPRVVVVRVAVDQQLDVFEPEAELFDVITNLRHGFSEAAVEQDVAARRGDQVRADL